jgi:hypothetical protein
MGDREEGGSISAFVLHHRRVLQMLAEKRILTAIAGEPVGQEGIGLRDSP